MKRHSLIVLVQCLLVTACLIEFSFAGIPGGETEADSSNPVYKALAEESLNKYLKDSNANRHHKVVEIIKVKKQVVAGSLKKIDFHASPTNCELTNGVLKADSKNCEVINPSDTISCHSEVYERVWENFKEIKVSCKQ